MGFGRIRRHPRSAPRRGSVLPRADTHDGPRYSVVIPAFNEQAYLGACLASLAAQDYPGAFEVIVVDNNSTDDTAVIAAAAGATVVVEPEQGVCQARQRGTEVARGEIVISHRRRHDLPARVVVRHRRGVRPPPRRRRGRRDLPLRGRPAVGNPVLDAAGSGRCPW